MDFLILAFSVVINSTRSAYSNLIGKNHLKNRCDIWGFNILCSVFSAIIIFIMSGGVKAASGYTIIMACVFGLAIMISFASLVMAMANGSMAYSVVFTACAMVIPTITGMIFWNEPVNLFQIIGLITMIFGFFLSVKPSKENKITLKWLKYVIISFLSSGCIGVIQKVFGFSKYNNETNEFLIISFIITALFSTVLLMLSSKKDEKFVFKSKVNINAVIIGICDGLQHKINLYLSAVLPSMICFPLLNGGAIVVSTIVSIVFFKEKLTKIQYISLAICVVSILLISDVISNFL